MKTIPRRDALRRSEEKAAKRQPEDFKDEVTDGKQVEIGPGSADGPAHGIDPPQRKKVLRVRGTGAPVDPQRDATDDRPPRTGV